MEIDYKDIGRRIREKRKAKKWNQEKLGEASGVEPSNISHIERGATKLSFPTLVKIANALETTLDELVCGSLLKSGPIYSREISALLSDCTDDELRAVAEMIRTTKSILRRRSDS